MSNQTKQIAIAARFETATAALEASGIDISYNPAEAHRSAKLLDVPNRHYKLLHAFLTSEGEVWTLIECADGLKIVSKFEPFFSCLDNSDFLVAQITETEIIIHEGLNFPKSARKTLCGWEGLIVA